MRIYAHRGCSAAYPENTLAAFRAAIDLGVDGIELDLRSSADGMPVVIHDARLDRTTNGTGAVQERTAEELATLDAGHGEPVPSLEEVFRLVGDRAHIDLEIKARGCETEILELLDRYPEVRAAISSFDWDVLARIKELEAGIELWVLTDEVTEAAVAVARDLGATTLAVDFVAIDAVSMERARSAGLKVMAWTVNVPEDAERMRRLGVVALCTDDPGGIR